LINKYGNGKFAPPEDEKKKLRQNYWLHYAEGSLMPFLVMKLVATTTKDKTPWLLKPMSGAVMGKVEQAYIDPNVENNLNFVEKELDGTLYFGGDDITGADFQMLFPLEAARKRVDMTQRPNILAYVKRCHERPAYQRALSKGGQYAYGSD
jgi:glutathione S-transferase